MKYADGNEAQIGDWVYGVPHNGQPPRAICAKVIDLNPDLKHQNMKLVTKVTRQLPQPVSEFYESKGTMSPDRTFEEVDDVRYGECEDFALVCRGEA